jgi:hypothetical protein
MKNIAKKLYLAALMLGLSAPQLSAQVVTKGSSHINVGYEFPDYLEAFISSIIPLSTVGPFTASYQYGFSNRFAAGIQVGYLQGKTPELSITDPATGTLSSYQATYGGLTLMAKTDFHYLKHNKLDLYSGLSAGVGFGAIKVIENKKITSSFSADLIVWHIRLAGLRYMVMDNIGVFAEGGLFTMYPNAVVGLSAKFGGTSKKY